MLWLNRTKGTIVDSVSCRAKRAARVIIEIAVPYSVEFSCPESFYRYLVTTAVACCVLVRWTVHFACCLLLGLLADPPSCYIIGSDASMSIFEVCQLVSFRWHIRFEAFFFLVGRSLSPARG